MATKLFRVLTYGQAKPIMKLHESDHVIKRDHVSNWKLNKSSSARPIPGRVLTYDSLTMQSCKFTRKAWNENLYLSAKINRAKIFKIDILEKKFTWKLISFRQSNFFLQTFLIKALSLTKISKMILTQF